jgi:hypothetical protein
LGQKAPYLQLIALEILLNIAEISNGLLHFRRQIAQGLSPVVKYWSRVQAASTARVKRPLRASQNHGLVANIVLA